MYDEVVVGRLIPEDIDVKVVFMPEHETHRWGFHIHSGIWRYRTRAQAESHKPKVLETMRVNRLGVSKRKSKIRQENRSCATE